jgi:hypothetical protein
MCYQKTPWESTKWLWPGVRGPKSKVQGPRSIIIREALMAKKKGLLPPVHPGEVLREDLRDVHPREAA